MYTLIFIDCAFLFWILTGDVHTYFYLKEPYKRNCQLLPAWKTWKNDESKSCLLYLGFNPWNIKTIQYKIELNGHVI